MPPRGLVIREASEIPQAMQATAIALDCPPELNGKTLAEVAICMGGKM